MRNRGKERGIALLIAIFVLLLISVVAIALIVSSGTESALAGNYRSSTGVYYAALSGLEEARGRLLARNPNAFKTTNPTGFLPATGTPLNIGDAYYLINPVGGETVAPWDSSSAYPDNEFQSEFSTAPASPSPSALSVWNTSPLNSLGIPGPLYKWVRINAVSEISLNVDADGDTLVNSNTPLYYDGAHFSNSPSAGPQVLEITSFAALPNGSQKLLQYLVAPVGTDLSFPAALTLDGNINSFQSSKNSDFYVNGVDQQRGGNCPPAAAESPKPAIGAINSGAVTEVRNGIPPPYRYANYISLAPQPINPSVGDISASLIPAFQNESALDGGSQSVVQTITGLADYIVAGPANSLPDLGGPTRPVITVVRGSPPNGGDLNLTGTLNGYGLLLVTGDLTLYGQVTWHGVILVIGQGHLYIPNYGFGEIDGAVLVARTRHSDYNLRPNLGSVTFEIEDANYGNSGFYYNSCWVQAVFPPRNYKILSFHEISQ